MTFLIPSMKKLTIMTFIERSKFHEEVEEYIEKKIPRNSETNESSQTRQQNEDFLDSFISFDGNGNTDSEIMRYVHQPIQSKVDMKKWWFEHAKTYLKLFRLFMKLSCIPATTASSERAFSTSGNIVTDKRSMILPKHVNNLQISEIRDSMHQRR